MVNYDLHIHSTYSDGVLSLNEIINIAKTQGLKGFAITDHDTLEAFYDDAFKNNTDIEIIPGIEFSTYYNDVELHILGYFIDYNNKELKKIVSEIKKFRKNRVEKIISKLQNLGYDINYDDVVSSSDENLSIGRPHIARALVNKGYFKDTNEVFKKLLSSGRPAYVKRFKLSPREAISVIRKAKGIPILAHPFVSKNMISDNHIKIFLEAMIKEGIMGIEVFHSLHSRDQEGSLLNYAIKKDLLVTGGSDCHEKLNYKGKYIIGSFGINEDYFIKLKKARDSICQGE